MARAQSTSVGCTCLVCGAKFHAEPNVIAAGGGKFCCMPCYRKHRRSGQVACTCLKCGKSFKAKASRIGKGGGRYCSADCRRRRPRVCNWPVRSCETCGKVFQPKPVEVRRRGGKFCSRECYRQSMRIPVDRQFLDRLDTEAGGDCILWVGNQNVNGYGLLASQDCRRKRLMLAHRFAFEMAHGKIPAGMQVLHRCDVPRCVNPLHLFLGNHADNHADKVAKGRQQKGEQVHSAKLTEQQVRGIRTRYADGDVTQSQLALEHGISAGTVIGILKRRSWKHLA